jgi:hypothetical protein
LEEFVLVIVIETCDVEFQSTDATFAPGTVIEAIYFGAGAENRLFAFFAGFDYSTY